MTIAACYVSTEGVVFGADSTSSVQIGSGEHYFNHAQKIFELGEGSDWGVVTWGLGNLRERSHRTTFALLADGLRATPPTSVKEIAHRFADGYWYAYEHDLASYLAKPRELAALAAAGRQLTREEEAELRAVQVFACGFCIGGKCLPNRKPEAFVVRFQPLHRQPPVPQAVREGRPFFWGVPNFLERLVYGIDLDTLDAILQSGKWSGTVGELTELVLGNAHSLPATLPIRDAIDLVYSSIGTTIKALKFSQYAPICGGPIEVAVVTTDRPFRWVRHKAFDVAVG